MKTPPTSYLAEALTITLKVSRIKKICDKKRKRKRSEQ